MTNESKKWIIVITLILAYSLVKYIYNRPERPQEAPKHHYTESIDSAAPLGLPEYERATALLVKNNNIEELQPPGSKEIQKQHQAIIDGKNKTDILTARQKIEVYILRYKDLATSEQIKYGVPASITLAQGIIESRSGNSKLAKDCNNHFGIKCYSKKCGPDHCRNYTDDSHKDFFRKYKSVWESFRSHSKFLNRKHYKSLHECKDYKCWAKGLKKKGYATDKNYDKKLINIIKKYRLDKYDYVQPDTNK